MKRYFKYTIRMKFIGTRTVLKRYHLAQVTEGKEAKHSSLMDKTYSDLYNTRTTQLISINCEEITEAKYNRLKIQYGEAN
ncbi:hypothetical protein SAMN04488576_10423 [Bacillus sp. cl25]|nr:hypothetical protein BA201_10055 [Bacillus cereus]SDH75959.1 hypothetical protein SAMN04488578_10323 [Bacillus sp. cl96]SEA23562.1 hypothetical protein SAMN04488575_10323 [Bacillus sp. cl115]SHJ46157.1 hypothetical protein SAMN04488576_10423 [Bacillus sp. cl25]